MISNAYIYLLGSPGQSICVKCYVYCHHINTCIYCLSRFSDIVVGAPFYSVDYNEGRAYIFMNKDTDSFVSILAFSNICMYDFTIVSCRMSW